jgi:hypothetical protein
MLATGLETKPGAIVLLADCPIAGSWVNSSVGRGYLRDVADGAINQLSITPVIRHWPASP